MALRGLCPICGEEPHGAEHAAQIDKYRRDWVRWRSRDGEKRLGREDEGNENDYYRVPALPDRWIRVVEATCSTCRETYRLRVEYRLTEATRSGRNCTVDSLAQNAGTCKPCRLETEAQALEDAALDLRTTARRLRAERQTE